MLAPLIRTLALSIPLTLAVVTAAGACALPPQQMPPGKAPTAGADGPPATWFRVNGRSAWAEFSSYCWKRLCADTWNDAERDDLPVVTAHRGQVLKLHLGLHPTSPVMVVVGSSVVRRPAQQHVGVRVQRGGLYRVSTTGTHGDASYVFRVRVV